MLNFQQYLSGSRAGIYFSQVPPPSEPTERTIIPFEVTFFTPLTSQPQIQLYSQFSRSGPPQNRANRFSHLDPQWHFELENGTVTDFLTPDYSLMYNNSAVVGISGTTEFYYVDDMPSLNSPVIIWATLLMDTFPVADPNGTLLDDEKKQVPSYANSKVIAASPHYVNGRDPAYLEITRDGINDLHPLRWDGVEFPYTITVVGELANSCYSERRPILFDYPQTNEIGLSAGHEVNRVLLSAADITYQSVSSIVQTWNPITQYFKRTTSDGFHVGGFVQGSVTPGASAVTAVISAGAVVQYDSWQSYPSNVWVSNPENKTLHSIFYPQETPQSIIDTISSIIVPDFGASTYGVYDTPYITEVDPTLVWGFSGYGGIYGIALDACRDVWTTDFEQDALYKFDLVGNLLSSIDLTEMLSQTALAPASISIDSENNFWVTLFEGLSVVKFDTNAGSLSTALVIGLGDSTTIDSSYVSMPPIVETDKNDDIWVGYSNGISSRLIKYDGYTGNQITTANIDASATPIDIVVDGVDNSFWVTLAYGHDETATLGKVAKYSEIGTLSSENNFAVPGYITMDNEQGVWFTYDYNRVGHIDILGGTESFAITSDVAAPTGLYYDSSLQGIGADELNRIWVIDSVSNIVYVLSAGQSTFDQSEFVSFDITPDVNTSWYYDPILGYQTYTDPGLKSAQAYGDWTRSRYRLKYSSTQASSTITKYITGVSAPFTIKPFEDENNIRKFNESWDTAGQMKSYAIPEHINSNVNFFDNFLGGALGNATNQTQPIGPWSYERIANYVQNHSDIDTANIDQLYSLAQELDVNIDDYNLEWPADIKRVVNIISIAHEKLWGSRCQCNRNFGLNNVCTQCGHRHSKNRGDEFSYLSYEVSAGTPFVVKHRFGKEYKLLNPVDINSNFYYPLSTTSSISWLTSAQYFDYDFYHYDSTPCGEQVEGVINWDDNYTTLSENNSALSAWNTTNGIVDEIINYTLHKGLGLNG